MILLWQVDVKYIYPSSMPVRSLSWPLRRDILLQCISKKVRGGEVARTAGDPSNRSIPLLLLDTSFDVGRIWPSPG